MVDIIELETKHHKLAEKIKQVKREWEQILMKYPNVVGVGVGLKEIAGEKKRIPCIVVYVREKVPERSLAPKDVIPKNIEGIPVDVKEMPIMRALGIIKHDENRTQKFRPLVGGISFGHPKITAGTLGLFLSLIHI